ncbi:MAG: hypothetical protein R3A78_02495 [Polyangiales bacterium]
MIAWILAAIAISYAVRLERRLRRMEALLQATGARMVADDAYRARRMEMVQKNGRVYLLIVVACVLVTPLLVALLAGSTEAVAMGVFGGLLLGLFLSWSMAWRLEKRIPPCPECGASGDPVVCRKCGLRLD